MSVSAAFHSVVPDIGRRGHALRAAFSSVLDRLAASPLDSSVLQAVGAPRRTPVERTALRAHWRAVTREDGTTRLEATWRREA
ncbi:hypothetical protein [Kitasatospora sp. NBC_01302]|uniref:hypothetical protein n=1 Tax=Kitasatospora sp. NBC_01302 TaxID=2903575 RepID=UPI002E0ECE56|nr:hypothetical protein OG294_02895 [Kitasatospora sp. NBC_01302]